MLLAIHLPGRVYTLLRTFLLLAFFLLVAYFLADVRIFQQIGRDTLYLCGNEERIKPLLIPQVFAAVGLTLAPSNAAQVLLYALGALMVIHILINPVERTLYRKLEKGIGALFPPRHPDLSESNTQPS